MRRSLLFVLRCWIALGVIVPPTLWAASAPQVVVSSKPLHSLLAGLMRGVADPNLLIADEQPPWTFHPTQAQRASIATADLMVWSGAALEPGIAAAMPGENARQRVVDVLADARVKLLPSRAAADRVDPYYWLDSRNMLMLLDQLGAELVDLDPQHATIYRRNWDSMGATISDLDRALEVGYRDVSGVPVFFYHDTHQYFAQAYAMYIDGSVAQLSATDSGGESVSAEQLLRTRVALGEAAPTCLFTERALDEPDLDLLTRDLDVEVVELDSFATGLPPGPNLYRDLMRANFSAIADCVRSHRRHSDNATSSTEQLAQDSPSTPFTPRYLMRDQYGRSISHEDFPGRLQLIYFGYTFCPDVCPTSLATMTQALALLGDDAEQIQPIFITVDPQRDTPELLAEYVKFFDPRLLGLSSSPAATRGIADLFHVRYETVAASDGNPAHYTMDHTSSLFLLGRRGEYLTKFAHGLPPRELAERLRGYLAR